jgi:hypothetical protein
MNQPTLVVEHVDASSVKLDPRTSQIRVGGTPEGKYKYPRRLPPIMGPVPPIMGPPRSTS